MKKRFLIAGIAAAAVFATVLGVAASLGVTSENLGAGSDDVASCDPNGVTTSYTVAWDNSDKQFEVTQVTVSGIASECADHNVQIALLSGSSTLATAGPQTVGSSGGSVNFSISPGVPAAQVTDIHVTIYK